MEVILTIVAVAVIVVLRLLAARRDTVGESFFPPLRLLRRRK